MDPLDTMIKDAVTRKAADELLRGRTVFVAGASGSGPSFYASAVSRIAEVPSLLVVAHLDEADEAFDELRGAGVDAIRLPALEVLPGESDVSLELFAERLGVVRRVMRMGADEATVVVCPIQALMQSVPHPNEIGNLSRTVKRADELDPSDLVRWLDGAGYRRCDAIEEPGDFAVRGGIIDLFPPAGGAQDRVGAIPIRLDFFGDTVDRITEIDLETMGSDRAVDEVELACADLEKANLEGKFSFIDLLPSSTLAFLVETLELTEQARGYFERATDSRSIFGPPAVFARISERLGAIAEVNAIGPGASSGSVEVSLPTRRLPELSREVHTAIGEVDALAPAGWRVLITCQNDAERQRIDQLLDEFAATNRPRITTGVAYVHRGFIWDGPDDRLVLIPSHELLHRYQTRRRAARLRAGRAMDTFLEFEPGDHVVHAEHGIARFIGLKSMRARGRDGKPLKKAEPEEYLTLEFAGRSKLQVPATQIDLVQKYVGGFKGKPPLSTLGGVKWRNQKERVKESVRDLAAELLRVRAAREHLPGIRYPADTAWQREFEAEFPFDETDDQIAAMSAIKRDMQHERPMDRLVCGDVGFGKTELAIRAAFKAVEAGRQVAILVPTTVLAEQHERTFRGRFAAYPFRIESISRFKTGKQTTEVLGALRRGQVDIIIGTHRLLSKDIAFADLGLVVVDEEQRFGVEHKERLLQLRLTADVLTLSATPIPRTLHMSLLGLRDISSLATAPLDRQAIVTEVIPWNGRRIKQAIERELARDGQIFYVHNRVHDIQTAADDVQKLAPDARVVIGHGQMAAGELEKVMLRFMRREVDILVSTTIIESGIDIPTANTMIIADADRFGLAELHQLRGRVGRYKHRAYCYLLLPLTRTPNETARRRLKAIEQYNMLGAGFKIAMRDLEIRGAGNLLGQEQSGHIALVGYDMYCRLLEQAVHDLNNEETATPSRTSIEIGVRGVIPRAYIPSDMRRMEAYRRIAAATSPDELTSVRNDLSHAYGDPPQTVENLIDLAEIRVGGDAIGVRAIVIRGPDVVFRTGHPDAVVDRLEGAQGTVRSLAPKSNEDLAEVYYRPPESYMEARTLLTVLRKRLAAAENSKLKAQSSKLESGVRQRSSFERCRCSSRSKFVPSIRI